MLLLLLKKYENKKNMQENNKVVLFLGRSLKCTKDVLARK